MAADNTWGAKLKLNTHVHARRWRDEGKGGKEAAISEEGQKQPLLTEQCGARGGVRSAPACLAARRSKRRGAQPERRRASRARDRTRVVPYTSDLPKPSPPRWRASSPSVWTLSNSRARLASARTPPCSPTPRNNSASAGTTTNPTSRAFLINFSKAKASST